MNSLCDSCKCSSGIPKSARSLDTTELVKSLLFRIGVGCLIFFVDIMCGRKAHDELLKMFPVILPFPSQIF